MELLVELYCKVPNKTEGDQKLGGLEHYYDPSDMNAVIYHKRTEADDDRIQTILNDADRLLSACEGGYDDSTHYRLLVRVIREQTVRNEDGTLRLKTKEDGGMNSEILQNPADPEAAYREKAGKQNRGYAANVTEAVGENGSIVSDYQLSENTRSDTDFPGGYLEGETKPRSVDFSSQTVLIAVMI